MNHIIPFIWFAKGAEDAAQYYVDIFKKGGKEASITRTLKYDEISAVPSGQKPGTVLTVDFTLDGNKFGVINGGPMFKLTSAVSFMIMCDTQEEIDYFWNALLAGGHALECGWLVDMFGVTWQVVPQALGDMLADPDREKAGRAMTAMLQMVKLDLNDLTRAYNGA